MTDIRPAMPMGRPMRPPLPAWTLELVESHEVTPHMRRLVFTGEGLAQMDYRPGQDLAIQVPQEDGSFGRRHYTIRSLDRAAGRLAIDFVLHGHGGPAERFAREAKPGARLQANGPRGGAYVRPEADWHLFVGDETCLPGILHMIETLPAGAKGWAFIEVESAADEQPVNTQGDVEVVWIRRDGPSVPGSPALIRAVEDFQFPAGRGHACVIGETSTVRAQRQGLLARGLSREQINAEGYWRPGRMGGHDHIRDE